MQGGRGIGVGRYKTSWGLGSAIIRRSDRETVFSVRLQVVNNGADGVVAKAATLVEVMGQKVWASRW